jgi:DNA-binding transcriptional regulator YiaG
MTGDEMRTILREAGANQARFAELLGVSEEHVSRWRHGLYPVPTYAAKLLRLVQGNHVTFETIEALAIFD